MRVAIFEDDPATGFLLNAIVRAAGVDTELVLDDYADRMVAIDWSAVDAVSADKDLTTFDGEDVLAYVATRNPKTRRILLTGSTSARYESAHAHRVLIKPEAPMLILDALGVSDG